MGEDFSWHSLIFQEQIGMKTVRRAMQEMNGDGAV